MALPQWLIQNGHLRIMPQLSLIHLIATEGWSSSCVYGKGAGASRGNVHTLEAQVWK